MNRSINDNHFCEFLARRPGLNSLRSGAFVLCALALVWPDAALAESLAKSEASNQNFQMASYQAQKSSPSPSPSMADSCLPLLKSIHKTPSAMDRTQRSAGTMAALGLILGVRYALSPPQISDETTADASSQTPAHSGRQSDVASLYEDRSALSVFAYRQCRKQQALKEVRRAL
jgi:hypothetical protein